MYHPEHGYYEQGPNRIGRQGDYYTNVSVGSVFGELLASDFSDRLTQLGPGKVVLVECGAHDGTLARDVLSWIRDWRGGVYDRLRYVIVEPSPRGQSLQRHALAQFTPHVEWCNGLSDLESRHVRGVIFANELLDAFPFHRLRWSTQDRHWHEAGVGLRDGCLVWVALPRTESRRQASAKGTYSNDEKNTAVAPVISAALLECLPDGFCFDYCPGAAVWWSRASRLLSEGALLTIDYGLTTEELLSPDRLGGTARAYQNHTVTGGILEAPGKRDLTAHVDFGSIAAAGVAAGLDTEFLMSQERFLMGIVAATQKKAGSFPDWSGHRRRQLQTLIHPCNMGHSFRVLCQARRGPIAR